MELGLQGRRALVTGSTAGIGLATARALLREGARVTLNGRTSARVQGAVDALRAELPSVAVDGIPADVGTASGCDELVRLLPETLAGTGVTVNSVLPGPTASRRGHLRRADGSRSRGGCRHRREGVLRIGPALLGDPALRHA